jgi:hypothetical protein
MSLIRRTTRDGMGIALQLLFTGPGVGSIYALVALGFVLIFIGPQTLSISLREIPPCLGLFRWSCSVLISSGVIGSEYLSPLQ